jgi:hypothetical protein
MTTNATERKLLENLLDLNREALIETVRGLSEDDAHPRLGPSACDEHCSS